MSAQKSKDETPTRHQGYSRIRANYNYLLELPDPDEVWLASHQSEGVKARLRACLDMGIIRVADKEGGDRVGRQYYRTDPDAYRDLQDLIERRDTLPCGHVGVDNIRGVDGYGCGYEFCDEVYGEETVRECLDY